MLLLIGALMMIGIFGFMGLLSQAMLFYIDLPSALIILIPLALFLAMTKSGAVIFEYVSKSFKKDYPFTAAELSSLAQAIKGAIRFILATGIFGFIGGIIACLGYLGAPEMLGPNLAISLLTILYAAALSFFVFFPTQAWAENRLKKTASAQ